MHLLQIFTNQIHPTQPQFLNEPNSTVILTSIAVSGLFAVTLFAAYRLAPHFQEAAEESTIDPALENYFNAVLTNHAEAWSTIERRSIEQRQPKCKFRN